MALGKTNSLASRYVKVSFVTWLSTAFYIIMQLISVPICLHYWGSNEYGSWLSLFAAFTIMRTVDGGHASYIGNQINILYHKNLNDLMETLSSSIYGCIFLGVLQILILCILYATGAMHLVLGTKGNVLSSYDAFIGLLILSISWVFTGSYMGIVQRLQYPVGMMYQAAWWNMAFQLTQFTALIGAAFLKMSIVQTAGMFAGIQAVVYIASGFYIRYKIPQFYPWVLQRNLRIGFKNLTRCLPITGGGILSQGSNNAVIMLISAIMGAVAVSSFSTLRTLSNLWTSLIQILTTPLIPDIIKFYVNKEWHKFIAILDVHVVLINSLINLSILLVYPALSYMYMRWTGNYLNLNVALLNMLLATVSVAGMTALISAFMNGINHSSYVVVVSSLRGGIGLSLGFVLLHYFGTVGIGVALLFAEFIVLIVTIVIFFKPVLYKNGYSSYTFFSSKGWLTPFSVIAFLIFNSFDYHSHIYFYISYLISLIVVLAGVTYSWNNIDTEVKQRLKRLVFRKNN